MVHTVHLARGGIDAQVRGLREGAGHWRGRGLIRPTISGHTRGTRIIAIPGAARAYRCALICPAAAGLRRNRVWTHAAACIAWAATFRTRDTMPHVAGFQRVTASKVGFSRGGRINSLWKRAHDVATDEFASRESWNPRAIGEYFTSAPTFPRGEIARRKR